MILHPEVEKILKNGRLSNPSQHGITGREKIGTMEDVADAIKRNLTFKDDEPIIGQDELYVSFFFSSKKFVPFLPYQLKKKKNFLPLFRSDNIIPNLDKSRNVKKKSFEIA